LTPHHNDQLVARHLLRHGHPKIKPHTSRSQRDRHAHIADDRISTPTTARQPRSAHGLNIYDVTITKWCAAAERRCGLAARA
jgi:hypothetical protein